MPWVLCLLGAASCGMVQFSLLAGLAVACGAAVLGVTTLGIEAVAERLAVPASAAEPGTGSIHHGVQQEAPAQAANTRAGMALLLGASRFWVVALALLGVVLLAGKAWSGPVIGGFLFAALVDAACRLAQLRQR